jgi:hypothetical protein
MQPTNNELQSPMHTVHDTLRLQAMDYLQNVFERSGTLQQP